VGRQTNAVDWLLLRAWFYPFSRRKAVAIAKAILDKLVEYGVGQLDATQQEGLEVAAGDCIGEWCEWCHSDDARDWHDSIADNQDFNPRSWKGWPTETLRNLFTEWLDKGYEPKLATTLELGRRVDQGMRPFARHSIQFLRQPATDRHAVTLSRPWVVGVRKAAQSMGLHLPAECTEGSVSNMPELVDSIDHHLRTQISKWYERHASFDGKAPLRPKWDACDGCLYFRGNVAKRFRNAARNQRLILAAFEEQGWDERIDDPLPGTDGKVPKHRLKDTIKSLNRNLQFIRFLGDGTGTGVEWQSEEW
jgi:hypothetical protein